MGRGGPARGRLPAALYEDGDLLVLEKRAGQPVHPSPGHEEGALTEEALRMAPCMAGVGSATRPGVVHRLDVDTSGVVAMAKTQRAYLALRAMFESHEGVEKTYLAVLHGAPSPREGRLETLIGRKGRDPVRMAVDGRDGKRAVTHWTFLQRNGPLALVEFRIETGRTHQIRVHAAHLGHPVAGDPLYGDRAADRRMASPPRRTLLHAVGLAFAHPVTGRRMEFFSEPPADILFAH